MKMLFSRWNSAPPSRDGRPLFQPFSWKSHAPSQRRSRRSPRYSLFTLSKIKNRLEPIGSTQNIASPDRCSVPRSAPGRSRGCCATAAAVDTNDALRRSVGGGGERNRTDDLLLAKQALSQLSYTPQVFGRPAARRPGRRQQLRSRALVEGNRESRAAQDKTPSHQLDDAPLSAAFSAPGRSRRNWRCACRGSRPCAKRMARGGPGRIWNADLTAIK